VPVSVFGVTGELPSAPGPAAYPEDAPASDDEAQGVACPVSFAQVADSSPEAALVREVEELQPWHDRARERRGHSMVGLSKLSPVAAAQALAQFLRDQTITSIDGLNTGETVKLVCEDLRTYYYEAAAARPGTPNADAIQNWFWRDTACGQAFLALYKICIASSDASLQKLQATSLVPRGVLLETA